VDQETRAPEFNLLGLALVGAGVFDSEIAAANIDHDSRPAVPEAGITPEYGEYLVNVSSCRTCHGEALSGGKNADPNAKSAPNLTPGGELAGWDQADFVTSIREGKTPSGRQLDPAEMPWEHYRYLADDELEALWVYLNSLPKLPSTAP
jgi:hypothetical protein